MFINKVGGYQKRVLCGILFISKVVYYLWRKNIMKQFSRVYIEITNVCNLKCSFCIGTTRTPHFMTIKEFEDIIIKIKEHTKYIYLHVLGEPLLHSYLSDFLEIASKYKIKVNITTNGTLLNYKKDVLLNSKSLRKVSVSVHSLEVDDENHINKYIKNISSFVKEATKNNIICELRFWNLGVNGINNVNLFEKICEELNIEDEKIEEVEREITVKGNAKLLNKLYLGKEQRFEWPDIKLNYSSENKFCYGLRNQIAILCDGTVVPCCLDSSGQINLGNIHLNTLEEIINSKRALAIYNGFSNRKAVEELCKKCDYATRF